MPTEKKRRAILERRKRTHFVRLCTLFVFGSVLASAVIVSNLDDMYLANKNNVIVYMPEKMLTDADNSLLIQTTDGDGKPLANQQVTIEMRDEGGTRTVFEGETDETGMMIPDFPLDTDSDEISLVIKTGSETIMRNILVDSTARIYLSTDKPVYQPGQIIHMRTLTFEGERALASTKDVKIEVQAPDGTKIFGKTLAPNEYGIANLDYPLSDILPLGTYKVFATVGTETVQKSILVKLYTLPKFKIDYEGLRSWYTYDERIYATLNCSYFFGKPVAGDITLTAKSYLGVWTTVHNSSGTLSNGRYSFMIEPVRYTVGVPLNENNGYLELNVTITDEAGHTEQKSRMLSVAQNPLILTLLTESNVPNVESTYYAIVNYPDGVPVESAEVFYRTTSTPTTRVYTDGKGIASMKFVYQNQDKLYVDVEKDSYEVSVTHRLSSPNAIKIVSDKTHYEVFDQGSFTVYYTGESFTKWVYYEVIAKGLVLSTGRFQLEGGFGQFELTMDADMTPLAQVRVYKTQKSLEVASDSVMVGVSSIKGLDVEITTDKDVYRPQEDVSLNFTVSSDGSPVTSALGISIVDQSVFEISERFQGFEEVFMSLEEEFTQPAYQIKYYVFSEDGNFIPPNAPRELDLGTGDEPNMVSSWPLRVDEASQLESDTIGNFFSVFGSLMIVGYLGLIVAGLKFKSLAVLALVLIMIVPIVTVFLYFATIGLAPSTGIAPTTAGTDLLLGEETTPTGQWDTWERFRTEYGYETLDTLDGPPGGGIAEPRIIRIFFPETWYWNPSLITDGQGKASLTLTTPDSMTSWGIEASASTKDARFGISGENITVFQEFFVEPDIPVAVIQNDTFPLRVMVYNYLPTENNVTVQLTNDTWFELLDQNEKSVLVSPNTVSSVMFRIKALEPGIHNVSILAGNQQISDAVVRKLMVETKGMKVEHLKSGRLDDTDSVTESITLSSSGIPGSEVAYVKLQPGMESVVVDGAEKYIVFVSGCGEQSTSRLSVDVAAYKHLMEIGLTDEQMAKYEQIITQGVQHEMMYLVDDPSSGGKAISWFGKSPDLWLTAWATFAFKDLEDIGFEIDEGLLPSFHTYLVSNQDSDGSFIFPDVGHWSINSNLQNERLTATAYMTRALLYSGYPADSNAVTRSISYIEQNVDAESDDSFTLALVAIALTDGGGSSSLRTGIIDRLTELKVDDDDKSSHWEYPNAPGGEPYYGSHPNTVETTAYASIAFNRVGMGSTVLRAITYLLSHRSEGRWGSTHDTAVAFQAIAEMDTSSENDLTVTVTADSTQVSSIHLTSADRDYTFYIDLSQYIANLNMQVTIDSAGTGMVMYQIYYSQYFPWFAVDPQAEELYLEVTYDATQIAVDDYLAAHLSMRYNGPLPMARMILVDLRSPVGFSFETDDFDDLVLDGVVSYYETSPRQMKLYLENVVRGELIQFDYRLHADLPITGTIQGVNAFDMYDPSISTTLEPVTVEST
ncbi:MAG: alpha-2-macroglobulin family protein [Thermoplasmata archaeon]